MEYEAIDSTVEYGAGVSVPLAAPVSIFDLHALADNLSRAGHQGAKPATFHQTDTVMKQTPKPKDVDAYIAAAPTEVRAKLNELRELIRKTAPAAVERISYGMPYYEYNGRLAYFSIWKTHIGVYIPTPIIEDHKNELSAYETTEATVRLPLNKKLPVALLRKLIKARMKRNEAAKKA